MESKKRILFGALGGATPFIITLLYIDFRILATSYDLFDWIGLAVRCIILVFMGGFVAYMHKKENDIWKIFQLGIAAPALCGIVISGNQGNSQYFPQPQEKVSMEFSIINKAYAQDTIKIKNEALLKKPEISATSRFMRGLLGIKVRTTENKWFVIVGSHEKVEDANSQVKQLKEKNYIAEVFQPYGLSKYYAVVIASNVSKEKAVQIKNQAIKDGLPPDTYLWSY